MGGGSFTPTQGYWRFGTNLDPPSVWLANENVKPVLTSEDIIRLIVSIVESGGAAGSGAWVVQYREGTGGTWTDLGASNHWKWANGASTEGATHVFGALSDANSNGQVIETSSFSSSVSKSKTSEFDLSIQPVAGNYTGGTDYYFRVVSIGVTGVSAGASYPVVTTPSTATTYTKTPTLDAVLQKLYTKTPTLDALLNKADLTKIATLDSYLSKVYSVAAELDAVLQGEESVETTLDALLNASGLTRETFLDAYLQSVGEEQTVTLDAILVQSTTYMLTVALDALLNKADSTKLLDLDALLSKSGLSTSTTLDSFLQLSDQVKTVVLDAFLVATGVPAVTIDALLSLVDSKTVSLDAILFSFDTYLREVTLDGVLSKAGMVKSLSLDAILWDGVSTPTPFKPIYRPRRR